MFAKAAILLPLMWDRFYGSLTGSAGLDATIVLTTTLAVRPIGAFIFGRLADRFGRRPVLMFDVLCYSALAFASAFAPSFTVFLVIRALFGIAMGGEWGGGRVAYDGKRSDRRRAGVVSGILQSGYASRLSLVSLLIWRSRRALSADRLARHVLRRRVLPALLVVYIRTLRPGIARRGIAEPAA